MSDKEKLKPCSGVIHINGEYEVQCSLPSGHEGKCTFNLPGVHYFDGPRPTEAALQARIDELEGALREISRDDGTWGGSDSCALSETILEMQSEARKALNPQGKRS